MKYINETTIMCQLISESKLAVMDLNTMKILKTMEGSLDTDYQLIPDDGGKIWLPYYFLVHAYYHMENSYARYMPAESLMMFTDIWCQFV